MMFQRSFSHENEEKVADQIIICLHKDSLLNMLIVLLHVLPSKIFSTIIMNHNYFSALLTGNTSYREPLNKLE